MNQRLQRYSGIFLIALSLLTVAQAVYFSHQNQVITSHNRRVTECQAKYNEQFIKQLKARSEIADSDRESMATLVKEVTNAKSRDDSRKALTKYLETKENNDEQRKRHPLAELPASAQC